VTAFVDRLRAGERLAGTVLALPGAPVAELAAAPFDLVWIDLEHGALDVAQAQELTLAAQAAGTAALVRVPRWDWDRLPAVLDAGVDGVVAPGVERAEHAEAVVARLRHPPDGRRGFGPRRAGRYGRAPAAEPACLVQVESPAGVAAARRLAAVPGLDGLIVGCSDLSLALGVPHDLSSAPLRAAIADVREAARGAGTAFGLAGGGTATQLAELGGAEARLLVHSTDVRLFAQAVDGAAADLRAALAAVTDLEEDHVRV
jgi:4-hydroxy-2-oxoheptanedioate aldolase